MRYIVTAMLSAAAMAAIPLTAIAQDEDPIHQAIEARKGFYQMLAINMGQLAGMAKGDIAYDEAAASRAAANIEALTQYDLPSLFIEGSGRGQTSEETAAQTLRKILDDFSTLSFKAGAGYFSCTFSAGVAGFPSLRTAEQLVLAADQALYRAKNSGRRQVVVAARDAD